ncbi:hypothetical protein MTR67_029484 [Solanum verrucosum]|uniref:Uncharacterized protein n=1 Tax=Solanum verrucosum TaxID=315347 RepID=A0AAF0TXP7_SOLVR|nr:hypothetical protein MTR67_029484 [Solanum verrucosum]
MSGQVLMSTSTDKHYTFFRITIEACVAVAAHLQSQASIVGEKFYGQ